MDIKLKRKLEEYVLVPLVLFFKLLGFLIATAWSIITIFN